MGAEVNSTETALRVSRVGKKPVEVPAGVKVTVAGQKFSATGPKGTLGFDVHAAIQLKLDGGAVTLAPQAGATEGYAQFQGLTRALVRNVLEGVSKGYAQSLDLIGTGYRAAAKGSNIELALGFSHPVVIEPPKGITLTVEGNTKIIISGVDKQAVGEVAANIRKIRKPEPYKGKGIRYEGERVRRKAGKSGK